MATTNKPANLLAANKILEQNPNELKEVQLILSATHRLRERLIELAKQFHGPENYDLWRQLVEAENDVRVASLRLMNVIDEKVYFPE